MAALELGGGFIGCFPEHGATPAAWGCGNRMLVKG